VRTNHAAASANAVREVSQEKVMHPSLDTPAGVAAPDSYALSAPSRVPHLAIFVLPTGAAVSGHGSDRAAVSAVLKRRTDLPTPHGMDGDRADPDRSADRRVRVRVAAAPSSDNA